MALLRNPAICRLFLEALARARGKHGLVIYAWVLMPEHVHLSACALTVRTRPNPG